jgi:ATP-dependent DNA helicase RecG
MTIQDVEHIIKQGESEKLEFKTSFGKDYPNLKFTFDRQSGSIVAILSDISDKVGNKVGEMVGDKVGDKVGDMNLTENRKLIIEAMKNNKSITIKELSHIVGIAEKNIENNIKVLKEAGLIKRVGPTKGGYWEVIK